MMYLSLCIGIFGQKASGSHTHGGSWEDRRDLQQRLSRMQVPLYDGNGKMIARAWLQKLQTYLTLTPMIEEDVVQFATLHLDGIAYE